ncbi:MAG: hypothetical protein UW08_C0002G0066 [Parcubacteria group bacterium GW2011_GWB1_43_8b]|nr:MAG: hypothetical protein UW08_C0002G0066 [Parcubacteria group bacterium GW2011_GWB1_43_8b]
MQKKHLLILLGTLIVLVFFVFIYYDFTLQNFVEQNLGGQADNQIPPTEPNIVVFSPVPNEEVSGTISLSGKARVFESQLNARLIINNQKILEENITANAPDMGLFGDFSKEITIPQSANQDNLAAALEVFDYSAKDGSEIDKVVIPVFIKKSETTIIKVFFGNSKMDPAVERVIYKTQTVARKSLEELIKGPTDKETGESYFTSLNKEGIIIQSLVVEDGIAKADFNSELEKAVGGSCRVAAIRTQITETLKQFQTVKSVVISIDGRTEDILQP